VYTLVGRSGDPELHCTPEVVKARHCPCANPRLRLIPVATLVAGHRTNELPCRSSRRFIPVAGQTYQLPPIHHRRHEFPRGFPVIVREEIATARLMVRREHFVAQFAEAELGPAFRRAIRMLSDDVGLLHVSAGEWIAPFVHDSSEH
jgi:hypothetical protein